MTKTGPGRPQTKAAGKAAGPARSKHRQKGLGLGEGDGDSGADTQTIAALARGLEVLGAFRYGDHSLGNHELAERTGLPKPTVSRITFTLERCGYLRFDQRQRVYELGSKALTLGAIAMADANIRSAIRPMMQDLAEETGLNVGLGTRDGQLMFYIDVYDGNALVSLRVYPGFRLPIVTTAMGRAYLLEMTENERAVLLDELRQHYKDEWADIEGPLDADFRHAARTGYTTSMGEWHEEISAVGIAFRLPAHDTIYAINLGGPNYLMPSKKVETEIGPRIIKFRDDLRKYYGME